MLPDFHGFVQVIRSTPEIGLIDIDNGHVVVGLSDAFRKINLRGKLKGLLPKNQCGVGRFKPVVPAQIAQRFYFVGVGFGIQYLLNVFIAISKQWVYLKIHAKNKGKSDDNLHF